MLLGVIDIVLGLLLQINLQDIDPDIAREFGGGQPEGGSVIGLIALILLCALLLAALVFFIVFVIVKLVQINKTTKEIKAKQEELENRIGIGF